MDEDEATTLREAAEELRRRMSAEELPGLNVEFVLFEVSRLLEELSRAMAGGYPPRRHVTDAALDIAHHVLHFDPEGHRVKRGDQPG